MLSTKKFIKRYGSNICRHCVNRHLQVHLHPEDCLFEHGRHHCPACNEDDKHLVKGFRKKGWLKVFGRKIRKNAELLPVPVGRRGSHAERQESSSPETH